MLPNAFECFQTQYVRRPPPPPLAVRPHGLSNNAHPFVRWMPLPKTETAAAAATAAAVAAVAVWRRTVGGGGGGGSDGGGGDSGGGGSGVGGLPQPAAVVGASSRA